MAMLRRMWLPACGSQPQAWRARLQHLVSLTILPAGAGVFDCKPLPVLWAKIPEYTADNTIMFDDLRRNYAFNPQNGLVIRPYRCALMDCAHCDRSPDGLPCM